MEDVSNVEHDTEACSLAAPCGRLTQQLAKLTSLIESGALMSMLRREMLLNPANCGDRSLSAHEADVVEAVARFARAVPISRLTPPQVACLSRLERSGFLIVERPMVRVTRRGRALGAARAHERRASRMELGHVRDVLARMAR